MTKTSADNSLIHRTTIRKEINGVSPGCYEWHNNRAAAELAALPETVVLETSPNCLWRAKVANAPEIEYCGLCDMDHQYATDCPEHHEHDPSPQEQWEVTIIGGWG